MPSEFVEGSEWTNTCTSTGSQFTEVVTDCICRYREVTTRACLSVSNYSLTFEPPDTDPDTVIACISVITTGRRGLKIKVTEQGQVP